MHSVCRKPVVREKIRARNLTGCEHRIWRKIRRRERCGAVLRADPLEEEVLAETGIPESDGVDSDADQERFAVSRTARSESP
jgi:hypothetical protein